MDWGEGRKREREKGKKERQRETGRRGRQTEMKRSFN